MKTYKTEKEARDAMKVGLVYLPQVCPWSQGTVVEPQNLCGNWCPFFSITGNDKAGEVRVRLSCTGVTHVFVIEDSNV